MTSRNFAMFTLLALAGSSAMAHGDPGSAAPGFLAGLVHPFGGVDHWLVACGLGFWAGWVLVRDARISLTAGLGLLLLAALYGLGHGAMMLDNGASAGFAGGLATATLALVLAGLAVQRALATRLAIQRS